MSALTSMVHQKTILLCLVLMESLVQVLSPTSASKCSEPSTVLGTQSIMFPKWIFGQIFPGHFLAHNSIPSNVIVIYLAVILLCFYLLVVFLLLLLFFFYLDEKVIEQYMVDYQEEK